MDNPNSSPVNPTGTQGASSGIPAASSPSSAAPKPLSLSSATPNTTSFSGTATPSAGSLDGSSIPPQGIGSASLGLNGNNEPVQTRMADQQAAAEFQQAHPNRTTSSVDRGAIKLANDNPKSTKKWLFIALGAVALLAVIGVVVAMIVSSAKRSNSTNNLSAEASFDQFANYILYGTDSTAPLEGEFDYWQDYKLDEEVAKSPIDEGWWEKAKALLERAVENQPTMRQVIIDDSGEETTIDNNDNSVALRSYLQDFQILYEYVQSPLLSLNDIVKVYADGNAEEARQYYNQRYSAAISSDDNDAKLVEAHNDRREALIALVSEYLLEGCIVNNEIDDACVEKLPVDEGEINKRTVVGSTANLIDEMMFSLMKNLEGKCWSLSLSLVETIDNTEVNNSEEKTDE